LIGRCWRQIAKDIFNHTQAILKKSFATSDSERQLPSQPPTDAVQDLLVLKIERAAQDYNGRMARLLSNISRFGKHGKRLSSWLVHQTFCS
jgi:hypothetical protein